MTRTARPKTASSTVRYRHIQLSGGAQAPAAPQHWNCAVGDYFCPLSLLPPFPTFFSSFPFLFCTGFVRNSASTSSVFSLSFGRHSRFLVSCLTTGAKRCVGFGPVSQLILFCPCFCWSPLGYFSLLPRSTVPPVPGTWVACAHAINPPPPKLENVARNTSRDLAPLPVKRRFCDLAGALGYSLKIPLLSWSSSLIPRRTAHTIPSISALKALFTYNPKHSPSWVCCRTKENDSH
ncbi:hypothetical protein BDW62DRAFT_50207 [Aspergillus aurantiobrunneus]